MALVAFILGLAIGIGFSLWQQDKQRQQLEQILNMFQIDNSVVSLPLMARLRRAIALSNLQQEYLETQLQIWQLILQTAPIGYIQVDEENQLLWCNQQARQMLNIQKWEPGQVRLLLEVVRSYELDELIENTRQQQQPCQREWVFHSAWPLTETIGTQSAITIYGYGWPLPEGKVGVFLENRQSLVDLVRARDRWLSDLAHEFKTPLTSISLVAEALQIRLEPPLRHWVDRLIKEVNRLINLVQDLLELRQIEDTPAKTLNRKNIELRSLILSVWQTLEPLAKQKQLNLVYFGPDTIYIEADESRLYRVFLNLLDNSIKYSPFQANICLKIHFIAIPSYVQIDIIDSGSGFAETDLPQVFERFYRGDTARARILEDSENTEELPNNISSGSGLGLAIVRQIILAHGGSVQAKNDPETGGAWVQIQLPI